MRLDSSNLQTKDGIEVYDHTLLTLAEANTVFLERGYYKSAKNIPRAAVN